MNEQLGGSWQGLWEWLSSKRTDSRASPKMPSKQNHHLPRAGLRFSGSCTPPSSKSPLTLARRRKTWLSLWRHEIGHGCPKAPICEGTVICLLPYLLHPSRMSPHSDSIVKSLSHVRLCDPVDCSLPGFSVHGILQARILEWVTISFSRGSSGPWDLTWVSRIGGRHFNL